MADEYGRVTVEIRNVLPKSVWVVHPSDDDEVNIPRSLLHAASDKDVESAIRGDELELKIREWKLKRLGWS